MRYFKIDCSRAIVPRSHDDKVEMIVIFGASNENYHEAERRFNIAHPDKPVARKTYLDSFQMFHAQVGILYAKTNSLKLLHNLLKIRSNPPDQ
ncbi:hypothetical protein J6590_004109 [Homalodisca vitripennis]|nr:hypothetical protein J6590_004109 [Homalodisca vitripennis]